MWFNAVSAETMRVMRVSHASGLVIQGNSPSQCVQQSSEIIRLRNIKNCTASQIINEIRKKGNCDTIKKQTTHHCGGLSPIVAGVVPSPSSCIEMTSLRKRWSGGPGARTKLGQGTRASERNKRNIFKRSWADWETTVVGQLAMT